MSTQDNAAKITAALTGSNGLTISEIMQLTSLTNSQVRRALKLPQFERMQDRGGLIFFRLRK